MKHLGWQTRGHFGNHFGNQFGSYRVARPVYGRNSFWNMLTDVEDFLDRTMKVDDTAAEASEASDQAVDGEKKPTPGWTFTPRTNIEETKTAYRLSFDLPGVKKEDVKIDVHGRTLTVSGERKREASESEAKDENESSGYRRYECVTGSFSRSFTLPETVDAARVAASLADGVLKVTLPKSEEEKPRSIEVK